eukprot:m.14630 g.14630  ORF g.14630 m.14630 type:complete len:86 (-) comp8062_c0_seq1:69-326(-)
MAQPAVLFLHGSRQCGEIFSQRMKRVVRQLQRVHGEWQCLFPDAPFVHPATAEDEAPMRTWWLEPSDVAAARATALAAVSDPNAG